MAQIVREGTLWARMRNRVVSRENRLSLSVKSCSDLTKFRVDAACRPTNNCAAAERNSKPRRHIDFGFVCSTGLGVPFMKRALAAVLLLTALLVLAKVAFRPLGRATRDVSVSAPSVVTDEQAAAEAGLAARYPNERELVAR